MCHALIELSQFQLVSVVRQCPVGIGLETGRKYLSEEKCRSHVNGELLYYVAGAKWCQPEVNGFILFKSQSAG